MHDLPDIVVHRRAQPKQLRPLLRRRHNPARIDAGAQHPNLRFEQLHPGVVSGTHPLRQKYQDRIENGIHPKSFRLEISLKRPKNTGWRAVDTFPNLLVIQGVHSCDAATEGSEIGSPSCTSNCTLRIGKHGEHGKHGKGVAREVISLRRRKLLRF